MRKHIPDGFVDKSATRGIDMLYNPTAMSSGQIGGCGGLYGTSSTSQAGGFAILPALAATYAGLKAVQPFSKAKKILEDHVPENKKNSLGYKIGHRIASVGASLGFGNGLATAISDAPTFNGSQYIATLSGKRKMNKGGSKVKKQKGNGKRKKRKSKKH